MAPCVDRIIALDKDPVAYSRMLRAPMLRPAVSQRDFLGGELADEMGRMWTALGGKPFPAARNNVAAGQDPDADLEDASRTLCRCRKPRPARQTSAYPPTPTTSVTNTASAAVGSCAITRTHHPDARLAGHCSTGYIDDASTDGVRKNCSGFRHRKFPGCTCQEAPVLNSEHGGGGGV